MKMKILPLLLVTSALVLGACRSDSPAPPPVQKVPLLPDFSDLREPPAPEPEKLRMIPLAELPPAPPYPNFSEEGDATSAATAEAQSLPAPTVPSPFSEPDVPPAPKTEKTSLVGTEPTEVRMARLEQAVLAEQPKPAPVSRELLTPYSSRSAAEDEVIVLPEDTEGEVVAVSEEDEEPLAPTAEQRIWQEIRAVPKPAPETEAEALELAVNPAVAAPPALVPPKPEKVADTTMPLEPFTPRPYDDEGVVMVQTGLEMVVPELRLDSATVPDCAGEGVAVAVETTAGKQIQMLGADGKPCADANVLFDGASPAGQRQAAPGINIQVYNPTPDDAPRQPIYVDVPPTATVVPQGVADYATTPTDKLPRMIQADAVRKITPPGNLSETELAEMERMVGEPISGTARQDKLFATIKTWQERSGELPAESEAALADSLQADLSEIRQQAASQLASDYENQLENLAQQLRQVEVERDLIKSRHQQVAGRLEQGLQRTESERNMWRQEERKLREELDGLNQRTAELMARNERLKDSFSQREQAYLEKIARLQKDLAAAEAKADKARQEMILEAAQKIAEAERLAYAARLAEKDRLQRQAARLKLEGNTMLERANQLEEGRAVLVPGLSETFEDTFPPVRDLPGQIEPAAEPALPPFEALPVQIAVRDKPLKDVLQQVFNDLSPAIGTWQVEWELKGENIGIKEDAWTVTAETTLGEFLDYVSAQVAKVHGIDLYFQRFDKTRLFIIADGQEPR